MIVYYDAQNQFELTDDEFKAALPGFEKGKNVWVARLQVHLTPYYKWAGKKPNDPNLRVLHDGSKAIRKFGTWYSATQPDVKINMSYYPELLKDVDIDDKVNYLVAKRTRLTLSKKWTILNS